MRRFLREVPVVVLSLSAENPPSATLISNLEQPAAGKFGNSPRNSIKGPSFHKVDLALSRLVSLAATRTIDLRLEVFNLFNTFNWGLPNHNFGSGTFGRITTLTGDPRIMQFGVKYGF